MPPKQRTAGVARWRLGTRGRTILVVALAFVVFNAVFDVRMLLAERQFVADAQASALNGTFLRAQDYLGDAARQGLIFAVVASALTLVAGLRIARAGRRSPQPSMGR